MVTPCHVTSQTISGSAQLGSIPIFFRISVACGPYFPICLAYGGVSLGMAAGTFAGGLVGLAQTAAARNFAALESMLAASRVSFDLRLAALDDAIRSEAGKRWTVVPDSPLVAMTVEIGELYIAYDPSDRASLQFSVWLRVKWKQGFGRGNAEQVRFVHQGPLTDVTLWIDPNERFLDDSLRRAFDDIARQMVGVLAGELPYKVRGMRIVPAKGDGAAAGSVRE